MNFNDKVVNQNLVIALHEKRLDASRASDFKERMAEFIQRGHDTILLDLSAVDFIDSSGLGALVSCLKTMGSKGRLVLFGLAPSVVSLFQLTRMDKIFPIYPNEEKALEAL